MLRWLERWWYVFPTLGVAALVPLVISGARFDLEHPELRPTALAVLGVAAIGFGAWLFAQPYRRHEAFKKRAADLADRMEAWLKDELANDPLPTGSAYSTDKVAAKNRLWAVVGNKARTEFGPEIRSLNDDLADEQIDAKFPLPIAVQEVRGLYRDLRKFSRRKGPLPGK